MDKYYLEEHIKNNVSIVSKNGKKYILKRKENPRDDKKILSFIVNALGLNKNHFFKELSLIKNLASCDYSYFKYPSLIDTDNESYFIIDYIKGVHKINLDKYDIKKLTKALVEFQTKSSGVNFNFVNKLLNKIFSPVLFILRQCFSSVLKHCGVRTSIRVLFLTFKISCRNASQKNTFLLHRDLLQRPVSYSNGRFYYKNLIAVNKSDFYFIDFGSFIKTKKFFYKDIVDLAFNLKSTKLHFGLINQYRIELESLDYIKKINQIDQIRISLIQNVLAEMNLKRERENCIRFLKETLLSEQSFLIWYKKQLK